MLRNLPTPNLYFPGLHFLWPNSKTQPPLQQSDFSSVNSWQILTSFLFLVTITLYFSKPLACQSRELRSEPKPSSLGKRQSSLRANYCHLHLDIMDVVTRPSDAYLSGGMRLYKTVYFSCLGSTGQGEDSCVSLWQENLHSNQKDQHLELFKDCFSNIIYNREATYFFLLPFFHLEYSQSFYRVHQWIHNLTSQQQQLIKSVNVYNKCRHWFSEASPRHCVENLCVHSLLCRHLGSTALAGWRHLDSKSQQTGTEVTWEPSKSFAGNKVAVRLFLNVHKQ